jgi:hypothetical protein
MPILVHRLLGVAVQVTGFFGGALVGWLVSCLFVVAGAAARDAGAPRVLLGVGYVLVMVIGATCGLGAAFLGCNLGYWLFGRHVPARCPQ